MFLSNSRLSYVSVSRASSATDMRPVSTRRKSNVSTVAAPVSFRSASIGLRACSRARIASAPMWRHSTWSPNSFAAFSIRWSAWAVQCAPLSAATAVTRGIAPSLTNERMSSTRSFRRRFDCTGCAGSKSALMASIIPEMPFSGNAESPPSFLLYFPCSKVIWSSRSSGGSKYKASTPKSFPPSTIPSIVCSSARSNAALATRKRNATERLRSSSVPNRSSLSKVSDCSSTMPDTLWSMICAARDIAPIIGQSADPRTVHLLLPQART